MFTFCKTWWARRKNPGKKITQLKWPKYQKPKIWDEGNIKVFYNVKIVQGPDGVSCGQKERGTYLKIYLLGMIATVLRARKARKVRSAARLPRSIPIVLMKTKSPKHWHLKFPTTSSHSKDRTVFLAVKKGLLKINLPGMIATVLRARKTRKVRSAARLPRSIPIVMYLWMILRNVLLVNRGGRYWSLW